jgi:hypothetical protein
MSTPSAELADALTRSTTTQAVHMAEVEHAQPAAIPAILEDWFLNPNEDWNFPLALLSYVESSFYDL